MKYQRKVEIVTESYEEAQFILDKFPEAWWNVVDDKTTIFLVPVAKEQLVQEAYNEFKERKR